MAWNIQAVFYAKMANSDVVPAHPAINDDDDEVGDNDVVDPDLIPATHNQDILSISDTDPSPKRKRLQHVVEKIQENHSENSEDEGNHNGDDDGTDIL